jgi:hypothetical protein
MSGQILHCVQEDSFHFVIESLMGIYQFLALLNNPNEPLFLPNITPFL